MVGAMLKKGSGRRRITGTVVACLAILSLGATTAEAATCKADKFIASIGKDLFSAAKSGSKRGFKQVVTRYAHTHQIGTFALGKYRKSLPKGDRGAYSKLVADFVAGLMAENAAQFHGNRFEIVRCPSDGQLISVSSKLHSDRHGVRPVIFRLKQQKSSFKILDVNVHGVWLGVQLRSKFTAVLKKNKGNIQGLYAFLNPRGAKNEPSGGK